jgi:hypothetical protein
LEIERKIKMESDLKGRGSFIWSKETRKRNKIKITKSISKEEGAPGWAVGGVAAAAGEA